MPLYDIRDPVLTGKENDSCPVEWSRSVVSVRREEKNLCSMKNWKYT